MEARKTFLFGGLSTGVADARKRAVNAAGLKAQTTRELKKKKKVVGRSEVVEMDVKRTTASHRKSVAQTEGGGGDCGIPHWDVCHCFAR